MIIYLQFGYISIATLSFLFQDGAWEKKVFQQQSEKTRECIIKLYNSENESAKESFIMYAELNNKFMASFAEKITETFSKVITNNTNKLRKQHNRDKCDRPTTV